MATTLAERLLQHEETPPQASWQTIALALGETIELVPLADKLQHYEVIPPDGAWTAIAAELYAYNTRKPAVVKNLTALYKVSAVAISIGLVCTAGFYFFSKKPFKQGFLPVAIKPKDTGPKPTLRKLQDIIQESVTPPPLAILNKARTAISRKRKKYYAKADTVRLHNAAVDHLSFADTLISIMVNTKLIRNEKGAVIQNLNLLNNGDNKYISITSPNGEQTKISSKFLHALLYMRDNNYLDNFHGYVDRSFLESLVWKLKFQSWRKKLLETPFIPSSYNYLDIFEFKELITREN